MAGATSVWRAYKEVIKQETLAQELFILHEKYGKAKFEMRLGFLLTFPPGDIVRISPNEVSYFCLIYSEILVWLTYIQSLLQSYILEVRPHFMISTTAAKDGTRIRASTEPRVSLADLSCF